MNLVLDYPLWFVGLCMLVGLAYALGLYYREVSFAEKSTTYNRILGFLRWATVTIICLLLLDPVMRSVTTEKRAPIVVLAHDNSESIRERTSEAELAQYQQNMQKLQAILGEKYELRTYTFGDKLRDSLDFSYTDKVTNIASLFEQIYDLYSNQNLSTVIMASDGVYNQGNNPIYPALKLNLPIFTIALGDTVPKKDLVLKRTYNNQIAYLGDKFSVQMDIGAVNCAGASTRLVVRKGSATLVDKPLSIDKDDFFKTEELLLDASQAGIQKYTISLSTVAGELSTANNSKDIYIEVLDARQKILILAESPHPDLGTFKRVISNNKNYEVQIRYPETLKENVNGFDMVVLHQLPSNRNKITDVLNTLQNGKIPHLYVVGTQTNLVDFNQSQGLLSINGRTNQNNPAEAVMAPVFNLFTIDKRVTENLNKLPPLVAPFGDFSARANASVLLTQKIGSVDTKYPLLMFGEERGTKKGILAAEGFWSWRIADYAQHQTFDIFDELLNKTIVYLSSKEDKRKFRVFVSNNLYRENEQISIDAELYNANYERINTPEANLEVTDGEGKKYPYVFNKTSNAYNLNLGKLPVGDYKFEAKTNHNGETFTAGGAFSVQSIQLELFETTADHRLLYNLAQQNGGQMVYSNEIEKLAELIQAKGFAKPILYDTVKTRSLIHQKWIFFLLLGLLTAEWFLRRYWGSY